MIEPGSGAFKALIPNVAAWKAGQEMDGRWYDLIGEYEDQMGEMVVMADWLPGSIQSILKTKENNEIMK